MYIYNVDPSCPEIRDDNWEECNSKGWRWMANLKINLPKQNAIHLEQLQFLHGLTHITLGLPWDDKALRPRMDYEHIGIYIQDVDEMIGELILAIYEWGVLE